MKYNTSDMMCVGYKSIHIHKSNNRRRAITSIIDEGEKFTMVTRENTIIVLRGQSVLKGIPTLFFS